MLREQIEGEEGRPWLEHLESDEGRAGKFPVDKPASDNSKLVISETLIRVALRVDGNICSGTQSAPVVPT